MRCVGPAILVLATATVLIAQDVEFKNPRPIPSPLSIDHSNPPMPLLLRQQWRPIGSLSPRPCLELRSDITPPPGPLPLDEANMADASTPSRQQAAPILHAWHASHLTHDRLYFEQPMLERYGHTKSPLMQPVISGVVFFRQVALWPANAYLGPPHGPVYANSASSGAATSCRSCEGDVNCIPASPICPTSNSAQR